MVFSGMLLGMVGLVFAQEVGPPPASSEPEPVEDETNESEDAEAASAEEAAPVEESVAAPVEQGVEVRVELINGMVLVGDAPLMEVIAWSAGDPIHFTPTGGTQIQLPGDRIVSLGQVSTAPPAPTAPVGSQAIGAPAPAVEIDPKWANYTSPEGFKLPNPAASRYLYAPSAIPLKAEQGYVSQKVVFTSVAYAFTDNFTALLGTFTFFPPLLTIAAAKYGVQVNDNVHVGLGGEVFMIPYESTVAAGVAFGSVTYGNHDKHFTVATGIAGGDPDFLLEDPAIPLMVGGHARLSDRAAFVTENWLVFDTNALGPRGGDVPPILALVGTAAVRIIGQRDTALRKRAYSYTKEGFPRTTWDIGLLYTEFRETYQYNTFETQYNYFPLGPIPWVDWTWHFGPAG